MSGPKRARLDEGKNGEEDGDDDLLALADVLDFAEEQEQEVMKPHAPDSAGAPLSSGSVLRLMRNLMVDQPPVLACISVSDNIVRLWDGQRAVDALCSSVTFAPGCVYRLDKFSNDRWQGKRELRVFGASKVAQLEPAQLPVSVVMHDEVLAESEQPAALRTATELAAVTGQTLRVAFHALYVMNGNAADAHDYLVDKKVMGWTTEEDAAVLSEDVLERRLHKALLTRSSDDQQRRIDFLKK